MERGTVCISVPHSKLWGLDPSAPVIYTSMDNKIAVKSFSADLVYYMCMLI